MNRDRKSQLSAGLFVVLVFTAGYARADDPSTPTYSTGDWFGIRPALEKKGLSIGGFVQLDATKVLNGGFDTDSFPLRYLFDLNFTLDTQTAFGWKGGTFYFDFQTHDGPNASQTAVGDLQGFDNQDSVSFIQIAQLWYQQEIADGKFHVKAGKIDANNDFSVIDHGSEFLQSSATLSPTILPMTTYPYAAPGTELFFQPADIFYAGIGGFYANSQHTFLEISGHPEVVERSNDGGFYIAEMGSRWKFSLNGQTLPGHAGLGGWFRTGESPKIDDPSRNDHGVGGSYFFLDQTLWAEDAVKEQPSRNLGMFFMAGYSDPRVSPIDEQLGSGITATGFIPKRPADVMGALISWARLPPEPGIIHGQEVAGEIFYKFQISPWFSLKPDYQYIASPSGRFPDASVATLRAEIDF